MTDTEVTTSAPEMLQPTAGQALVTLEALAASAGPQDPQPVDNAPKQPATPASASKTAGQALIDRFTEQTVRLQNIRQRLEHVLANIDGRRVGPEGEASTLKPRPTSYFEGLHFLADCKDSVMEGLDKVASELEALF